MSPEWFNRPDDERYFSLDDLWASVNGRSERSRIRLLTRRTRSVAPTEAGERLRQTLAPRIEEIEVASLMEFRDKPAGTIRITLSDHALQSSVWQKLRQVLCDYPDIKVELHIDNGFRNIVEERFDPAFALAKASRRI